jgi:hypothetical protein
MILEVVFERMKEIEGAEKWFEVFDNSCKLKSSRYQLENKCLKSVSNSFTFT